ncbi:hypothetical protein HBB16_03620 [Pseudonocardia sp. MCCB 268]|nr:hypothetical protein [Pseudonocardia cytotoxica]
MSGGVKVADPIGSAVAVDAYHQVLPAAAVPLVASVPHCWSWRWARCSWSGPGPGWPPWSARAAPGGVRRRAAQAWARGAVDRLHGASVAGTGPAGRGTVPLVCCAISASWRSRCGCR